MNDSTTIGPRLGTLLIVAMSLWAGTLALHLEMVAETRVQFPLRADAGQYYSAAYNLLHFGVLSVVPPGEESAEPPRPDTQRNPGYPLFILPFIEFPPNESVINEIGMAQAILSGFTVLLALALMRRLLPWPFAVSAAVLTALSPHLMVSDVYVLTESLFTFCLLLFVWTLSRLISSSNPGWAISAGAALGLTVLVRETTSYLWLFLVIGLFLVFSWRRMIRLTGLVLLGYALIYGPLYARNTINSDIAKPSMRSLGSVHNGMYPGLMYNNDPRSQGIPHRADPNYSDIDTWGKLIVEIRSRFEQEPVRYLYWYFIGKPMMFFSWNSVAGWGDVFVYPVYTSPFHTNPLFEVLHDMMHALHWPLTLLALMGTLLIWAPSARDSLSSEQLRFGRLLSLVILYFLVVHMIGTPLPRYATPLRPLLFGMSMFAVWSIREVWCMSRNRSAEPHIEAGGP